MKNLSLLFVGVLSFAVSGVALAERPSHFQGESADSLEQAVTNFVDYNQQLSALVTQEKLAPADLTKVHELTYTLENALAKISTELVTLAETLEEVHVASERFDAEAVKTHGSSYLDTAGQIVR